ncbi:MAG TPA: hypothetical protein VHC40_02495 [Rhizomicrobium sp.]|jgi:hypothetical protein|nr:hypothetical protein [Rhizomicrobium sp.]
MGMETIFGAGAAILAVAVAWAILRNRRRNPANDTVGQAATREEYREPDRYDPGKFRKELRPGR